MILKNECLWKLEFESTSRCGSSNSLDAERARFVERCADRREADEAGMSGCRSLLPSDSERLALSDAYVVLLLMLLCELYSSEVVVFDEL